MLENKKRLEDIEKDIEDSKILLFLLNGNAINSLGSDKENEKIILLKFLNGKSLRRLSTEYGIDRERISNGLREIFKQYPEELEAFDRIVDSRKASATIDVEQKEFEEMVEKVLFDNMTQKDASEILAMDPETFRTKMIQLINKNQRYRFFYTKKESKRRPDYSFINFKSLLLDMLRNGKSQSDIGAEYGIPARRISREIENLSEEDAFLKKACKMQAQIPWRRLKEYELKSIEEFIISTAVDIYADYNEPIIIDNPKSHQDQELEKIEKILEVANSVEGTNKQKADAAGISISTLRRVKIRHDMLVECKTNLDKEKETEVEK